MADQEHVEVVRQGAEAIRKWREANPDVNLDLSGADLQQADLSTADLRENLIAANLIQANLTEADLTGANLGDANLSNANLNRAILRSAILDGAIFSGAELGGTKFTRALLRGTVFADVDISGTEGLETLWHNGPSTIGIDTLYKSRGNIPEVFLRGCGVPDALIAFLPKLLASQDFYSCFISYSHKDEEFAKRLYSRMRDEHLRVWYAPEDIKGGRKLHEQIEEAIRVYDKLLLVLSETSMQSEWVATEIYYARKREVKEKKQVLFPIRLVPFEAIETWKCLSDMGKDMAVEIREYFIPDFSNWKDHDSFEAGFKRLLEDLKAGSQK